MKKNEKEGVVRETKNEYGQGWTQGGTYFRNEIGAALFFGGGNVKIILCESGTSGAGKADAAATRL